MPSVVSIPPNSRTAALEMASASVSGPATSASSEEAGGAAMTCRRLAASSANAARPAAASLGSGSVCAPASAWTVCAPAVGPDRLRPRLGLDRLRPGGGGLGLDRGHDPVVPGEDLRGVGAPEAEHFGHDRDG